MRPQAWSCPLLREACHLGGEGIDAVASDSDRSNGPAGHRRAPEGFLQPSDCQVLQAGGVEEDPECGPQGSRLMVLGMREVPGSADVGTDSSPILDVCMSVIL